MASAGARVFILSAYRPAEVALGRPLTSLAPEHGEPAAKRERHPLEKALSEFKRRFGEIEIDLEEADGRRFVEGYLDAEPNRLEDSFREMLTRQTGAHPLFTVELLRGMQERGDLIQDAEGRWVEGSELDWEVLPGRVEAVIAERVNRLPKPLRGALRAASVEGEVFAAEVVARAQVVGEAENGSQAVEMYRELNPDLTTMDITMPEMDGLAALKEIRGSDPDACVVMCSAMGQQSMVVESIQAGARDFIVKPFQADRVLEAIQKALA